MLQVRDGWQVLQTTIQIHYKSGKLNVEADVLSRKPWEWEQALHTLDTIAVKAIISRGYSGDSSIPEIPSSTIAVIAKSLEVNSTTKLFKQHWKMEQQGDSDIEPIITLITTKHFCNTLQRKGIFLE